MTRVLLPAIPVLLVALSLTACAATTPPLPAASPVPATAPASLPGLPVVTPDVELRDATGALVHGTLVPMDGVAEGLTWPALQAATKRPPGAPSGRTITLGIARDVPLSTVIRAVWTLRDADVRLQTEGPSGTTRVLDLRPRDAAPPAADDHRCHLAVFVAPSGDLRIAAPGGARSIPGPDAAGTLARALSDERTRCPIRYVAFGADDAHAAWSTVFDVAVAVDRDKSAGDARYVLGEPVHLATR